ncbi:MAG: CBS domain-containing protein [candidate division Zixibacteria bacterium]|nr:CBS domain-containing protein [candidate division Zixibacteria bacterium]
MLVKILLKDKKKDLITARPETSIDEAMKLLIANNIGCLPIIDSNDQLVGIISDKDIFRRIHETGGQYHDLKVEDVMTTALILGFPDDDLSYIAGIMDKNWIRHVPIVDGDTLVGLVSQRDIIRAQAENREIENRYLKLYTEGIHLRDKSADF